MAVFVSDPPGPDQGWGGGQEWFSLHFPTLVHRPKWPVVHVMRASVWMTTRRMPVSGEGVGDQAGPEQENSCRRQCKKAVRDEVLIEHLTVSVLVRLRSLRSEKNLKTWLA